MQGGKLIGVGGQGCVYSPSFQGSESVVTKVEKITDAENEYRISQHLRSLDPNGNYYVPITSFTKTVNKEKISNEVSKSNVYKSNKTQCLRAVQNPSDYGAISVPLYTHELDNYYPNLKTDANMIHSWIHLLNAVYYFHSLQTVHGDIKLQNIAYRAKASPKKAFALTDFGWSEIFVDKEAIRDQFSQVNKFQKSNEPASNWSTLFKSVEYKNKKPSTSEMCLMLILNDYWGFADALHDYTDTLAQNNWPKDVVKRIRNFTNKYRTIKVQKEIFAKLNEFETEDSWKHMKTTSKYIRLLFFDFLKSFFKK